MVGGTENHKIILLHLLQRELSKQQTKIVAGTQNTGV